MNLTLALLGSGEFEPWAMEVDAWLIGQARAGDGTVLILPTASAPEGDEVFESWAEKGLDHYDRQGRKAEVLSLKTRDDAHNPGFVESVSRASLVFASGGNPAYFAATLSGTPFWQALFLAMQNGLAYAGCSAGAASLGERAPDSSVTDLTGEIWQPGLGPFPNAYIGPHWDALDQYLPGLRDFFVASIPEGRNLLTVDESTSVVGDGSSWSVIGTGSAAYLSEGTWTEAGSGEALGADLVGEAGRARLRRLPWSEKLNAVAATSEAPPLA